MCDAVSISPSLWPHRLAPLWDEEPPPTLNVVDADAKDENASWGNTRILYYYGGP